MMGTVERSYQNRNGDGPMKKIKSAKIFEILGKLSERRDNSPSLIVELNEYTEDLSRNRLSQSDVSYILTLAERLGVVVPEIEIVTDEIDESEVEPTNMNSGESRRQDGAQMESIRKNLSCFAQIVEAIRQRCGKLSYSPKLELEFVLINPDGNPMAFSKEGESIITKTNGYKHLLELCNEHELDVLIEITPQANTNSDTSYVAHIIISNLSMQD